LLLFIPRIFERDRIRCGIGCLIGVFGGGSKERKETLKSNNRIQHTCYSIHVFSELIVISFRVMPMRCLAIKVCKMSWHINIIHLV
jgi:hypothetical protein